MTNTEEDMKRARAEREAKYEATEQRHREVDEASIRANNAIRRERYFIGHTVWYATPARFKTYGFIPREEG